MHVRSRGCVEASCCWAAEAYEPLLVCLSDALINHRMPHVPMWCIKDAQSAVHWQLRASVSISSVFIASLRLKYNWIFRSFASTIEKWIFALLAYILKKSTDCYYCLAMLQLNLTFSVFYFHQSCLISTRHTSVIAYMLKKCDSQLQDRVGQD